MLSGPFFLRKAAVAVPLAVAALIALFGSESWAASPYWPTTFLELMKTLFPAIAAHAKKSAFPATTELYMGLSLLLLPLYTWYSYQEMTTPTAQAWYRNLWTLRSAWAAARRMALVLLILGIVLSTLFAPVAYDRNFMPYHSSRGALAAFGWIFAGGAQGGLLAWVACNLVLVTRFIRRRREAARRR